MQSDSADDAGSQYDEHHGSLTSHREWCYLRQARLRFATLLTLHVNKTINRTVTAGRVRGVPHATVALIHSASSMWLEAWLLT